MDETKKGFMQNIGDLSFKKIDEANFEYSIKVLENFLNTGGIAHGGFIATIADTGMGNAAHIAAGNKRCVTINLDIKFISAGKLNDKLIGKVKILKRTKKHVNIKKYRDIWWHEAIKNSNTDCSIEIMDSEDPLFILYTSGSTGKPKGIQHSTGGYMIYTEFSFRNVFQYDDGDVYWCTADIGWITGHSYIIYGPLLAGATTMMFEGVPSYPDAGRFWQIVEENKVNIFS